MEQYKPMHILPLFYVWIIGAMSAQNLDCFVFIKIGVKYVIPWVKHVNWMRGEADML